MNNMERITSRKFIVALAALVGLFVELHVGNIPVEMFRDLVLLIVGGYLGLNHLSAKKNGENK